MIPYLCQCGDVFYDVDSFVRHGESCTQAHDEPLPADTERTDQ